MKLWIFLLTVGMLIIGATLSSGCVVLTPEQETDLLEYEKLVQEVDKRLDEYRQSISDIAFAIREKNIPWKEGKALILDIQANKNKDLALKDKYIQSIDDLKESGIPTSTIIWKTLLGILTGGGALGMLARSWMKKKIGFEVTRADDAINERDTAEAQRNTIIVGVERGCDDLLKQLGEMGLDDVHLKELEKEMPVKAAITEEAELNGIEHTLHAIVREVI